MRAKRERQAALARLVRQQAVGNQVDLVRLLRKTGLHATQASVSRDLRELGLVKVNGRYQAVSRLRGAVSAADDGLHELISDVAPVGANLLIVRTRVGAASTVAVEIDRRLGAHIAGTVAGDDTIFVAVRSRSDQGRALAVLRGLVTLL